MAAGGVPEADRLVREDGWTWPPLGLLSGSRGPSSGSDAAFLLNQPEAAAEVASTRTRAGHPGRGSGALSKPPWDETALRAPCAMLMASVCCTYCRGAV